MKGLKLRFNPRTETVNTGSRPCVLGDEPRVLTTGQKSIRCVQNFDIHPLRILDLTSFACLTQTLKHRIHPASKHRLDLQCSRA
jgi:hypothetical protein